MIGLILLLAVIAFGAWFTYNYWWRYSDDSMDQVSYSGARSGRVVIVGCSIAGMNMAKALEPFYDEIVILERDQLPPLDAEYSEKLRGGVAHAPCPHVLLSRGIYVMELFFGKRLFDEFYRLGCMKFDICSTMCLKFFGVWKKRNEPNVGCVTVSATRFLYEQTIRRVLVEDTPRLKIIQQAKNATPIFAKAPAGQRATVTGVSYLEGKEEKTMTCDLLIDASGRQSQICKWLEKAGNVGNIDQETTIDAGVSYTAFMCERADGIMQVPAAAPDGRDDLAWNTLVIYENAPKNVSTHALMWPCERGRWLVCLGGLNKQQCPSNWQHATEWAANLDDPLLGEVMKELSPITPEFNNNPLNQGYLYNVPTSKRKHLERMTNFPIGLHVTGDAACCFNPIFGQGMTMACTYAVMLQREIKLNLVGKTHVAPQTAIQRACDSIRSKFWFTTFDAWSFSGVEDTRWEFTQTNTHPFWKVVYKVLHPIAAMFQKSNAMTVESFMWYMDLAQMNKPLVYMFHPRVLGTVLYHGFLFAIGKGTDNSAKSNGKVAPDDSKKRK